MIATQNNDTSAQPKLLLPAVFPRSSQRVLTLQRPDGTRKFLSPLEIFLPGHIACGLQFAVFHTVGPVRPVGLPFSL